MPSYCTFIRLSANDLIPSLFLHQYIGPTEKPTPNPKTCTN